MDMKRPRNQVKQGGSRSQHWTISFRSTFKPPIKDELHNVGNILMNLRRSSPIQAGLPEGAKRRGSGVLRETIFVGFCRHFLSVHMPSLLAHRPGKKVRNRAKKFVRKMQTEPQNTPETTGN